MLLLQERAEQAQFVVPAMLASGDARPGQGLDVRGPANLGRKPVNSQRMKRQLHGGSMTLAGGFSKGDCLRRPGA